MPSSIVSLITKNRGITTTTTNNTNTNTILAKTRTAAFHKL